MQELHADCCCNVLPPIYSIQICKLHSWVYCCCYRILLLSWLLLRQSGSSLPSSTAVVASCHIIDCLYYILTSLLWSSNVSIVLPITILGGEVRNVFFGVHCLLSLKISQNFLYLVWRSLKISSSIEFEDLSEFPLLLSLRISQNLILLGV